MFGGVGNQLCKDSTFLQLILFLRGGELSLEATKGFFCTPMMDFRPSTSHNSSFGLWTSKSLIQATVFRNSSEAMNGFSSNDFLRRIPRTRPNVEATYTFSVRRPAAENQLLDAGYPSSEMRFSNSTCWYLSGNSSAEADEQNLEGLPLHITEFNANHDFLAFNEGYRT